MPEVVREVAEFHKLHTYKSVLMNRGRGGGVWGVLPGESK